MIMPKTFRVRVAPMGTPATPVIPFAPGRVYKAVYRNYKHDPRPLIFVLSSSAYYTHGINIHYLGGAQGTLLRLIMDLRKTGQALTGLIMYRFMKQRYPTIPKLGYRLYFTRFLIGRLVSDGVSQVPLPSKERFAAEPFVSALNRMIRPRVVNRVRVTQAESDRLTYQMKTAVSEADRIGGTR